MTYTLSKPLSIEDFVAQYGNNPRYELADGELIDMELTGPHEAVGGKLAAKRGREPIITLCRSIKLVVEIVSTNWETDYARKVEEYALLVIPEY